MNLTRRQILAIVWVLIAIALLIFDNNLTGAVLSMGVVTLLVA